MQPKFSKQLSHLYTHKHTHTHNTHTHTIHILEEEFDCILQQALEDVVVLLCPSRSSASVFQRIEPAHRNTQQALQNIAMSIALYQDLASLLATPQSRQHGDAVGLDEFEWLPESSPRLPQDPIVTVKKTTAEDMTNL